MSTVLRSSITDQGVFPALCASAAKEAKRFAKFRRDPACTGVVETLSYHQAKEIPKIVLRQTPHYRDLAAEFRKNDWWGNPERCRFSGFGKMAPTTLRYIKVLSDLEVFFGNLAGMTMAEVGVGYGGQCSIIKSRFDVGTYTLIDLPPVVELAEAYLRKRRTTGVEFTPWEKLGVTPSDLALSNYALSEMRRDVQTFYIDRVFSHAKRGYLLWNELGEELQGMTAAEFAERIPGAKVIAKASPPLLKIDVACNVALITWGPTAH